MVLSEIAKCHCTPGTRVPVTGFAQAANYVHTLVHETRGKFPTGFAWAACIKKSESTFIKLTTKLISTLIQWHFCRWIRPGSQINIIITFPGFNSLTLEGPRGDDSGNLITNSRHGNPHFLRLFVRSFESN